MHDAFLRSSLSIQLTFQAAQLLTTSAEVLVSTVMKKGQPSNKYAYWMYTKYLNGTHI